jgi:hypothetical protein
MKRALVFLGVAVLALALLVGAARASRAAALSFAPHLDYGTGTNPNSVAVGDFNKDGKPDLATANFTASTVSVLLGNGSGGFAKTATDPAVGANPYSVAIGDFNRDGKPELATANYGDGTASVLLNTTVIKPRIGALRPRRGEKGTTVTISGSFFGARRGTSKVYFGTKAATKYVSWSASKIKVKVPRMSKGRKAVRVKTADGRSNVRYFRVI